MLETAATGFGESEEAYRGGAGRRKILTGEKERKKSAVFWRVVVKEKFSVLVVCYYTVDVVKVCEFGAFSGVKEKCLSGANQSVRRQKVVERRAHKKPEPQRAAPKSTRGRPLD